MCIKKKETYSGTIVWVLYRRPHDKGWKKTQLSSSFIYSEHVVYRIFDKTHDSSDKESIPDTEEE